MILGVNVLVIILGVLVIYAIPCFIAHYLDFGWKFISGKWFHDDFPLVKKLRSGIFHQTLILFFLAILIYGGVKDVLGFLPADWGRSDASGEFHPYSRPIASLVALILAGINMYGFRMADKFFDQFTDK